MSFNTHLKPLWSFPLHSAYSGSGISILFFFLFFLYTTMMSLSSLKDIKEIQGYSLHTSQLLPFLMSPWLLYSPLISLWSFCCFPVLNKILLGFLHVNVCGLLYWHRRCTHKNVSNPSTDATDKCTYKCRSFLWKRMIGGGLGSIQKENPGKGAAWSGLWLDTL